MKRYRDKNLPSSTPCPSFKSYRVFLRIDKNYDVASMEGSEIVYLKRLKVPKEQDLYFISCYSTMACLTNRTKQEPVA